MKKIFLVLALVAAFFGCTQQGKWNAEQRREARQMLREWRDLVYLQDMTDSEFIIFTDNVTDLLEVEYPDYTEFIAMPMVGDSVEMVVVTAIVADIQANYQNMRHIFPYKMLVQSAILPEGLTRGQQTEYYQCLAGKINTEFGSMRAFIWGAINSTLDDILINGYQQQCAVPYWNVESVTVIEETN